LEGPHDAALSFSPGRRQGLSAIRKGLHHEGRRQQLFLNAQIIGHPMDANSVVRDLFDGLITMAADAIA
jgi:hypothetical protein